MSYDNVLNKNNNLLNAKKTDKKNYSNVLIVKDGSKENLFNIDMKGDDEIIKPKKKLKEMKEKETKDNKESNNSGKNTQERSRPIRKARARTSQSQNSETSIVLDTLQ